MRDFTTFLLIVAAFFMGWSFRGAHEQVKSVRPPRIVYDLPAYEEPYMDLNGARHLHCPEEINNGGYRDGKFVYLN